MLCGGKAHTQWQVGYRVNLRCCGDTGGADEWKVRWMETLIKEMRNLELRAGQAFRDRFA